MTPTFEQTEIIRAVKETSSNLLISALAGSGKTSTLTLIAKALSQTPILSIAFNKKIALEMEDKLPGNCESATMNSLGHRAWGNFLGKRLIVKTGKNYDLLKEAVEALPSAAREEAFKDFSDTLKMIEAGKQAGYVPSGTHPNLKPLLNDDEFFSSLEDIPSALQERLIREVSSRSIDLGMKGTIDFSDQLFLPVIFPVSFNKRELLLVDEAQDLSNLNHVMIKKIYKNRLIAVGDKCQAIYGFRGAHKDGMAALQQLFNMKEFPLSISFRCPRSVVRAANFRAPNMTAPDWAEEGEVKVLKNFKVADFPQNPAIICRNNAPLFSMAIWLLENGRYPELIGNDVVKGLIKILEKFGPGTLPQNEALEKAADWRDFKKTKVRNKGRIEDQYRCLCIFINQGTNLREAIAYANHISNSSGPVKLMTGHKAKGLEFDDVFFLDENLIGSNGQEPNIKYVIITRAMKTLTYISSKDITHE